MYSYEILPSLQKILEKLYKRDKVLYESAIKKIDEVINSADVEHYKNLRYDLKDKKRVHVGGSFVLVFKFIESENKIVFVDFDHHDQIYLRKS
ncbi:MAG TPA: type II toxin-antitoxin system RelE/ParE family toxin [Candidatus Nanoarchaeia archaeon]|nr:type II toxin-antitoxin system RelE/ParE family toxin [Candidatus Nanoarchaeia archaeon]